MASGLPGTAIDPDGVPTLLEGIENVLAQCGTEIFGYLLRRRGPVERDSADTRRLGANLVGGGWSMILVARIYLQE